ncbi:MAG: hypothetical protein AB7O50_13365 [Pseudolabrys sp.]
MRALPSTQPFRGRPVALRALICAGMIAACVASAAAQDNQGQKTNDGPVANALGTVGRWFDEALSSIGSNFRSARSTVGSLGEEAGQAAKATANATANVAKDAADAVTRLPGARVVRGRQNCPPAANGAPDCVAAANALCKSKGFGSGRSVDVTSAEECPTAVMLGRRDAKPGECRPVTFITSAFCQ